MKTLLTVVLFAGYCLSQPGLVAQRQDDAADAARLVEVLKIHAGAHVADVGAGSGVLTVPIARVIGPTGRVYATDVNPERLQELRQLSPSVPDNLVVIEGGSARTNLPDGCCDAIFIRHVYHHFGDPAAMNASVFRALKPGGRIAIVDFPPEYGPSGPPGRRDTKVSHGVTPMTVAEELSAAGFVRVQQAAWTMSPHFLVMGERPE
jgi:ubiquinone/menaquinone biosynthesis C-methylase UbiE